MNKFYSDLEQIIEQSDVSESKVSEVEKSRSKGAVSSPIQEASNGKNPSIKPESSNSSSLVQQSSERYLQSGPKVKDFLIFNQLVDSRKRGSAKWYQSQPNVKMLSIKKNQLIKTINEEQEENQNQQIQLVPPKRLDTDSKFVLSGK